MTTATRPALFTGTPEQIIADVINAYSKRVSGYIAAHLARRDWHLVEDLTQETFTQLWRYHVARGATLDERLFGLLASIARQMICHHLRRRRSTEVPLDFTDPGVTEARTLQASQLDTPHLAAVYAELESAKSDLTEAAEQYREAARAVATARRALTNAVKPEAIERCTLRVGPLEAAARAALEGFRVAAERVAEIRAEWDAAATAYAGVAVAR